jgi:hypothetical protein
MGENTLNLHAQLAALTIKANVDPNAVSELQVLLREHPGIENDWRMLANMVFDSLLKTVSHGAGNREMFTRECKEMRERLGWAEASQIERMMIEHIVLCWLRFVYAELLVSTNAGNLTAADAEKLDRQISRAHNGYIRACESLSRLQLLKQVEKEAAAKADIWDARAADARLQKPQNALRLLKAASQGD